MNSKKKVFLAGSILVLLFVSASCVLTDMKTRMQYHYLTPERQEKLISKMNPDEDMNFSLCFKQVKLPCNESERTFYLPVEKDSDVWEEGSFGATDDVEVFFLQDFKKENKSALVSGNAAIPFLAVSKKGYMICYLKLTGMPMISFEGTDLTAEDGNPLFDMVLYESCGKDDWITHVYTTATIRGNTSKEYEKKSLRLKLKKEKSDGSFQKTNKNLLGIRSDDDWILNSLYADNSRIRDKLCMDLWQETGARSNPYGANFGMQAEYAEVVINGGYAGLYLLTHPIDAKQLNMPRVSKQLEAGQTVVERIYKKKYTAAWKAEDFTGELPDQNLKNYRGGFFLKGDTVLGDTAEWQPLYEMAKCIEADDATFRRTIGQLADTENIADNWLFFQAIGGFDNENKNVYYIVRNKNEKSYGYFIPWDLNLSFGSVYADNTYYSEESMEEVHTPVRFEPGMRMVTLDAANSRKYVADTWSRWRSGAFDTERLLARMDDLQQELISSGAMERETARWPNGNANVDLSLMKEYARQRMEFVDSYVAGF